MSDNGYIKLYRKTLGSRVFANEGLFKVWMWCLMKANHKEKWASISTGRGEREVKVGPGQFIFGRNKAAEELSMKPSSVRNRIKKLKKMQNLDTQEDSHFTIISIVNWESYQSGKIKEDTQKDSERTGKGQAKDTNKNDKNEKNKDKPFSENSYEFRLARLLEKQIRQNDPQFKQPNLQSWAVHVDRLIRLDQRTPEDVAAVIRWCQSDSFWHSNILSTKKLREQFSQLYQKMKRNGKPKGGGGYETQPTVTTHGEYPVDVEVNE